MPDKPDRVRISFEVSRKTADALANLDVRRAGKPVGNIHEKARAAVLAFVAQHASWD